jgi:predicted RNA binding protein YcfA (HicA-like mRNA interferase family)
MPQRLRRLSARDVLVVLQGFGFEVVATRGSHAKLRRVTRDGQRQTLTVPLHRELDVGTIQAIYRQATRFIPESELRASFYSD